MLCWSYFVWYLVSLPGDLFPLPAFLGPQRVAVPFALLLTMPEETGSARSGVSVLPRTHGPGCALIARAILSAVPAVTSPWPSRLKVASCHHAHGTLFLGALVPFSERSPPVWLLLRLLERVCIK